jgi:hypothetical protein
MVSTVIFPKFIRPIELTAANGAFYARKEGYMASQEGIERTYTCLCLRANGQAICVDVNTSGKAGAQIPQLPLGDNSSPWGDNAVCM